LFRVPCSISDPDVTGSALARTIVAAASSGDAVGYIFAATAARTTAKKTPTSQTVRNIRLHPIRREESEATIGATRRRRDSNPKKADRVY